MGWPRIIAQYIPPGHKSDQGYYPRIFPQDTWEDILVQIMDHKPSYVLFTLLWPQFGCSSVHLRALGLHLGVPWGAEKSKRTPFRFPWLHFGSGLVRRLCLKMVDGEIGFSQITSWALRKMEKHFLLLSILENTKYSGRRTRRLSIWSAVFLRNIGCFVHIYVHGSRDWFLYKSEGQGPKGHGPKGPVCKGPWARRAIVT